jgi:hypothetical protein
MSVPSLASNRINPAFNQLDALETELDDLSAFTHTLSGAISMIILNDLSDELYALSGRVDGLSGTVDVVITTVDGLVLGLGDIQTDVLTTSENVNDLSGYVYSSLQAEVTDLSTYVYNISPGGTQDLFDVLTIGNDAQGLDISGVNKITCSTLNYTTLNPPISGATPNLSDVLTVGGNAGGLGKRIFNTGIQCAIGPIDPLNPPPPITTTRLGNSYLVIGGDTGIANVNPNIFIQNNYNNTDNNFLEFGAGTIWPWIGWKTGYGLLLGSETTNNAQGFSINSAFTNTSYQGYNAGITSGDSGSLPMYASAFNVVSDERNKTNVTDLSDGECLEIVKSLQPKRYDWKDGRGSEIGFIAQNVYANLPEAVKIGEGTTHDYCDDVSFSKSGSSIVITLGKSYVVSVGDLLKFEGEYTLTVLSISGSIVIAEDPEGKVEGPSGNLFLKGKQVSDFHYIKNNHSLTAVLVSAIQELSKEIEILKSKLP